MGIFKTLFCLSLAIYTVVGDCWETRECQQNSWQVKGCGQYGRVEQSRRPCGGGNFYTCCTSSAPAPAPSNGVRSGNTTRYWDCCKPSCSWSGKAPVSSPVKTCDKSGVNPLTADARSGCDGGNAFVCNTQQPFVVSSKLAYGFAAAVISGQSEYNSCCACYELTFTSGPVKGQKMVVQVTNTGADLGENHFDLQIPGGGVGIFNGCKPQWNFPDNVWGAQYGGVRSLADCSKLPPQIQDGCKFRFGWFKNADNPTMTFVPVTCPAEITNRSGCKRTA